MMTRYTFFYNPMSRAQIARWALHEVGADYDPVFVAWDDKPQALLDANPMGKLPTIIHHTPAGDHVVSEAAAICHYLAEAEGSDLLPKPAEKAPYFRWMFFAAGPLESAVTAKAMGWQLPADREVMAGFGRAGEWFAIDHWGVTPDLITFAKGVNSGYVPLGGVIIADEIAETFARRAYPGGLTYSGHPLACAAAVASINIFKEEGIIEHARSLGAEVIGPELAKLADRHPSVGEVRGLGVFWALELVRDQETREPLVPFNAAGADAQPMNELANACKRQGVWPFTHFNRVHVVPPCTISENELRDGLAVMDDALDVADRYYTGG